MYWRYLDQDMVVSIFGWLNLGQDRSVRVRSGFIKISAGVLM
jgi:hypothetical protein